VRITGKNLKSAIRPFPDAVANVMTEREFQVHVTTVAEQLGWWTYHTHDSRRSEPGFPDLTLVRGTRLVFAELKREGGRVTPAQRRVHVLLEGAGHLVRVWRPSDWPIVVATLNGPDTAKEEAA